MTDPGLMLKYANLARLSVAVADAGFTDQVIADALAAGGLPAWWLAVARVVAVAAGPANAAIATAAAASSPPPRIRRPKCGSFNRFTRSVHSRAAGQEWPVRSGN